MVVHLERRRGRGTPQTDRGSTPVGTQTRSQPPHRPVRSGGRRGEKLVGLEVQHTSGDLHSQGERFTSRSLNATFLQSKGGLVADLAEGNAPVFGPECRHCDQRRRPSTIPSRPTSRGQAPLNMPSPPRASRREHPETNAVRSLPHLDLQPVKSIRELITLDAIRRHRSLPNSDRRKPASITAFWPAGANKVVHRRPPKYQDIIRKVRDPMRRLPSAVHPIASPGSSSFGHVHLCLWRQWEAGSQPITVDKPLQRNPAAGLSIRAWRPPESARARIRMRYRGQKVGKR